MAMLLLRKWRRNEGRKSRHLKVNNCDCQITVSQKVKARKLKVKIQIGLNFFFLTAVYHHNDAIAPWDGNVFRNDSKNGLEAHL